MEYKSVIEDIRNNYAHAPKKRFRLSHPLWIYRTPLNSIYHDIDHLSENGKVVYGYLLKANSEIFHRKLFGEDLPGVVLYSMDPYYEAHPGEYAAIVRRIYKYIDKPEAPSDIKRILDLIANDFAHRQNVELPMAITPHGKVYYSAFMIWRKHLEGKCLKASILPIIADPEKVKSVLIVPKQYWTKEYASLYNDRIMPEETFTEEEIEEQQMLIEEKAQNRIRIKYLPGVKTRIMGQSKIGGLPHVTKDFIWPKTDNGYMNFLCQINLHETADYDTDHVLPEKGMLYLFYDMDEMVWGEEAEDKNYYRVIYDDSDNPLLETDCPGDIDIYKESVMLFEADKDYPLTDDIEGVSAELVQQLFGSRLDDTQEMNQVLGYPFLIQSSMDDEFNEMYEKLYGHVSKSHRLLIQLGNFDDQTYGDLMFGDAGNIYFFIDDEDLKNRDFEKVILFLQCY